MLSHMRKLGEMCLREPGLVLHYLLVKNERGYLGLSVEGDSARKRALAGLGWVCALVCLGLFGSATEWVPGRRAVTRTGGYFDLAYYARVPVFVEGVGA